ncbi:MAG: helix-turn-helix transcriptional regulator [Burkholderiaceae bacterium]
MPIEHQKSLTPREAETLMWIAQGLCNKSIATRLGIEVVTVKMHVGRIFRKLGVKNRTEAAVSYQRALSGTVEIRREG